MNNVVYISNQKDWNTMSLLKSSIDYYKQHNHTGKYNHALERESDLYHKYLCKYNIRGEEQWN